MLTRLLSRLAAGLLAALLLLTGCGVGTPPPDDRSGDPLQAPKALVLSGTAGTHTSFGIVNRSDEPLTWQLEVVADPSGENPQPGDWFRATPTSGTLSPGGTQQITLTLVEGLAPGDYRARLLLRDGDRRSAVDISGKVGEAVQVPAEVVLRGLPGAKASFDIVNAGAEPVDWTLQTEVDDAETGDWFQPSLASGRLQPGDRRTITLTLLDDLTPGEYAARLRLLHDDRSQTIAVRGVVLSEGDPPPSDTPPVDPPPIEPPADGDPLSGPASPLLLQGGAGTRAQFDLTNTGDVALDWNLRIDFDPEASNPQAGAWFSAAPSSGQLAAGASQTLTLTLAGGLAPGDYSARLTVAYPGGESTFAVEGRVESASAKDFTLALSPETLTLQAGASGESVLTVASEGEGGVALDITSAPQEAGIDATLSSDQPGQALLTVRVASTTAAGAYRVEVSGSRDGITKTVALGLTVTASGGTGGNGSLQGRVSTVNAEVPVTPPPVRASAPTASLAAGSAGGSEPAYVPGQLLVAYRDPAAPAPQGAALRLGGVDAPPLDAAALQRIRPQLLAAHGLRLLRERGAGRADLLALPAGSDVEAVARELERDPRVAFAEPNYLVYPMAAPSDPRTPELWQLPVTGLPLAWEARNSSEVVVAVVDSGVDTTHPDLASAIVNPGYDFCNARGSSGCTTDANPRPGRNNNQHGTHVAGLVAAVGNNGVGVAGALAGGARLVPVKVFPDVGPTTVEAVANGILYAAGIPVAGQTNPHPADIINLSLGLEDDASVIRNAVQAAQREGALVVAAAGNAPPGASDVIYPARYPEVLSVGAVNSALRRACFSRFSTSESVLKRHIMAPGGDRRDVNGDGQPEPECPNARNDGVLSTVPGNGYATMEGTSQATPLVVGVAALVWAQNPTFSAAQVRDALLASAHFDPSYMKRPQYGAGVLRADVALGFPGPGASVTVAVQGAASQETSVTLDPFGRSSDFRFAQLPNGDYTVTASAAGSSRSVTATTPLSLSPDESRDLELRLAR